MRLSVLGVLVGVVAAGLASGCQSELPTSRASEQSLAEIIATVSPCPPDMHIDGPDRREQVASLGPWLHVVGVDPIEWREVDPTPAVVTLADGTRAEIDLSAEVGPAIDWALTHDADLWLEGDPGYVVTAMIVSGDDVAFGGACQDQYFGDALRGIYGAEAASVLTEAVALPPEDAAKVLGWEPMADPGPEVLPPPKPGEAILADHPELAEGLHGISVEVRITEQLGPGELSPALCTHIAVGWSDCVNTDETTVAGANMSVPVDDTGTLEFWLLFDNTDVTKHKGYLGTVTVPTDGSIDTVVLTIDTTGVTRDTLPAESTGTQGLLQDTSFVMRRPEEAGDANW